MCNVLAWRTTLELMLFELFLVLLPSEHFHENEWRTTEEEEEEAWASVVESHT